MKHPRPLASISISMSPGVGLRIVMEFGHQVEDALPVVEVYPADTPRLLPARKQGAPPLKKKRVR